MKTVQVTYYLCDRCEKKHEQASSAEICCSCDKCETIVGVTRRDLFYEKLCDTCYRHQCVARARAAVARAAERLTRAHSDIADMEAELKKFTEQLSFAKQLPRNSKKETAA